MNDNVLLGVIVILSILIAVNLSIEKPGGKNALEFCKKTYGEDYTHRLRTRYYENKWHCEIVLMSCKIDGTDCYTIGNSYLGEVKKE